MKGACHWSNRVKAECDRCGMVPKTLHMPEFEHGWYCPRCCPVCRDEAPAPQAQEQSEKENSETNTSVPEVNVP